MKEVKDNLANELVAVYSYDANGNLTEKKTNGNTMVTSYEYNESNLPKKVSNQTVADPLQNIKGTYSEYNYTYYLDGNQSSVTDIFGKTKGYTYDAAGRLSTESIGTDETTISYTYDERGNRKGKYNNSNEEYVRYNYDANNRLESEVIDLLNSRYYTIAPANEDRTIYLYDKNGNMTYKNHYIHENPEIGDDEDYVYTEVNIKEEAYTYDKFNKLKTYTGKSYDEIGYEVEEETSASYAYDGTGTRIGKTVNGESTGQIWNNGNIIAEYGTKGIKTYIRGAGGEIVKTKDSASNNRYFSYNAHGDTTNIIEKKAESTAFAVTAAYEYDAFGSLVTGTGGGEAESNAFRYNGQYTDEETGLIYLRNRYYDPSIGRFTQEDPVQDGMNWYIYCENDPVNLIDPLGLDPDNYVMVKYSVEKIGGRIVGYDSDRLIAYIEYNGQTVGYQLDRVVQIQDDNGDMVTRGIGNVDSLYEFMASMGYGGSPDELLHNPYDRYNSMNETAYAWALRYNKWSMTNEKIDSGEQGYEMAAYIYLDSNTGQYYFGELERNARGTGKIITMYEDESAVGVIHSHGANSYGRYVDDRFSHSDINNFYKKHKYLVTPYGQLLYREAWIWLDNSTATIDGYVIAGTGSGIYY